jgi:hypothetical protein
LLKKLINNIGISTNTILAFNDPILQWYILHIINAINTRRLIPKIVKRFFKWILTEICLIVPEKKTGIPAINKTREMTIK